MHSENSFYFLSHGQTSSRCCQKKLWLPEASGGFGVIVCWEAFTCRMPKGVWFILPGVTWALSTGGSVRQSTGWCIHTLHKVDHPQLPFEWVKPIMKKLGPAHLLTWSPLSFSLACSLHFLRHGLYQLTPGLSRNMCFIQYIDLAYRKIIFHKIWKL